MKFLVTGASGFVGSHLVQALQTAGHEVRGSLRSKARLGALNGLADTVELVEADLGDKGSLEAACAGVEVVVHCAANVKFGVRDKRAVIRANDEGTRNILAAAQSKGVRRFVQVSTAAAIARRPMGATLPDEATETTVGQTVGIYERTKFLSERAALAANSADFETLVVNPCAPLGQRDVNVTPAGGVIRAFLRGKIPAYTRTGLNVVDVRDVALGMVLAAEKGKPGERYILGCENVTLKELLDRLAALSDRKSPRVRVPYALTLLGGVFGEIGALFTHKEPLASWASVRSARLPHWYSSEKAKRELGYTPRPIGEALELAVRWFEERQNG